MHGNAQHRRKLLADAEVAVNGDRNAEYGDPNQDFTRTAEFWSTYLGVPITPQQVGVMQILLKVSRSAWSPGKRDHYLDIAGYAACAWGVAASNADTETPAGTEAPTDAGPLADWGADLVGCTLTATQALQALPVGSKFKTSEGVEGRRIDPKALVTVTYVPDPIATEGRGAE